MQHDTSPFFPAARLSPSSPQTNPRHPSPPHEPSRSIAGHRHSPRRATLKRKFVFRDSEDESDASDLADEYLPAPQSRPRVKNESMACSSDSEDEVPPRQGTRNKRPQARQAVAASSSAPRNPSGQGRDKEKRRATDKDAQHQKRSRAKASSEAVSMLRLLVLSSRRRLTM
jgi:hypothetical protein